MKFGGFKPIDIEKGIGPVTVDLVNVSDISPNPDQPRKHFDKDSLSDLAASIKEHGVFTPIMVKKGGERKYEIIAGERRWRASKMANVDTIPVIIRGGDSKSNDAIALIENVQREDLNPLEMAESIKKMIEDYDLSHDSVAVLIGKGRSTVSNLLRLLKLNPSVQKMISEGKLDMGHARALSSLPHEEQFRFSEEAIKKGLSVRNLERRVRSFSKPKAMKAPPDDSRHERCNDLKKAIENEICSKVVVDINRKGEGTVTLTLKNSTETEALIALFLP